MRKPSTNVVPRKARTGSPEGSAVPGRAAQEGPKIDGDGRAGTGNGIEAHALAFSMLPLRASKDGGDEVLSGPHGDRTAPNLGSARTGRQHGQSPRGKHPRARPVDLKHRRSLS